MQNRFCRECKHSQPAPQSDWRLQCRHPKVLGQHAYALASPIVRGVDASEERGLGRFHGRCGMRGALWEFKQ